MAEWTDERMDDLAANMAAGFDRTDRAIGDVRSEVASLRIELKGDNENLRTELKDDIEGLRTELRGDIRLLHSMMSRFYIAAILCMGGLATALIGVLAAGPG